MVRLISLLAVLAVAQGLFAQDEKDEAQEAVTQTRPAQTQPAQTRPADALHPHVKMETTLGDIILELDAEKAPITVYNFVRYAEEGFYEGTIFHRVIPTFMIQGGGFTPEMEEKKQGLHRPIKNEWQNGLKNVRGTIAMARQGWRRGMSAEMRRKTADSATSQFFINLVDNDRLDHPQADGAAYCAFGKVVEGMDVVDKIRNVELHEHPKYPAPSPVTPVEPVVVRSVKLTNKYDRGKGAELVKACEEKLAAEEQAEKERAEKAMAAQQEQLQAYIEKLEKDTALEVQKTESGLMYVILKEGDGPSPEPTDIVEVHYTGWLIDLTKFDSSLKLGRPVTFRLNRVIKGWTEGVGMMKVGERRKLIIPPELGYGERGAPPRIPPNSYLVFDIELMGIK